MAEKQKTTESKWVACGGGDCSCATIWDREHDVPILKAYRGEWGDEYPVIKVEIDGLDRPDNARISAVMETMAYGYIDPKFSVKIVKQVTALPELVEATEKTIADIRLFANCFDDGSASKDFCIGIENRLRSALSKINGGGNG